MPMDDLNDQLPQRIPGLVLADDNARATDSDKTLPAPIAGVVLSDGDAPAASVTTVADKKLVAEVKADREFLVRLATKAEELRSNGELDAPMPSGKKLSDFKPGGTGYGEEGKEQTLTPEDISALMQSLEGDKEAIKRLREAYEEAFNEDGSVKEGKELEAKEFVIAVKAQMLAAQLISVSNDPAKIQIILNELRSLNVRGGGAAQSVIDAAQGQASGLLSAAISAISAVASGVASVVSAAASYVGDWFRSDEARRYIDSLNPLGVDKADIFKNGTMLSDRNQKIEALKEDFKLLQDGKGDLQLFKTEDPSDLTYAAKTEAERYALVVDEKGKLMGSVKNLMALKNSLAFMEDGDVASKLQANEGVVRAVNAKVDSIIAMQKNMMDIEKAGGVISDDDRKALNKAKVELKTFIQENVMKAPAALTTSRVASAAPTSGLRISTETPVVTDPSIGGRTV